MHYLVNILPCIIICIISDIMNRIVPIKKKKNEKKPSQTLILNSKRPADINMNLQQTILFFFFTKREL